MTQRVFKDKEIYLQFVRNHNFQRLNQEVCKKEIERLRSVAKEAETRLARWEKHLPTDIMTQTQDIILTTDQFFKMETGWDLGDNYEDSEYDLSSRKPRKKIRITRNERNLFEKLNDEKFFESHVESLGGRIDKMTFKIIFKKLPFTKKVNEIRDSIRDIEMEIIKIEEMKNSNSMLQNNELIFDSEQNITGRFLENPEQTNMHVGQGKLLLLELLFL